MAKLLLLGANGQVGYELCRAAPGDGLAVIGLARGQLDITERDAVEAAIRAQAPDLVVNAAAYTAVDKAESEPALAMAVNGEAPGFIAGTCQRQAIPLIHISTDYVFDGSQPGAYREDDPVSPLGAYGASKEAGERQVRQGLERHIILRTAWVFGAHGHNFVKTMLRLGETRDSLAVVADQTGGPTAAGDIAAAILEIARQILAAGQTDWGTYHFAGRPTTSWHGFASEIFARRQALTGRPSPQIEAIATADYPTAAQRPANSVLACDKIESVFAIAQPDWRQGLDSVLREVLA